VGELAGVKSIDYIDSIFTVGSAIQVELSSDNNDELNRAVALLKEEVAHYAGVSEIRDDFEPGKYELKLKLKPQAATLGITLADLARQVREGFYGAEAMRIQRGRNEVKVMVRYSGKERKTMASIDNMRIRGRSGVSVPFKAVADITYGRGYATITHANRARTVTVFANIDENLKVEIDGQTIYNDKFNTVPYAKAADNGVPVGSIMPFAGAVSSGNNLDEPMTGWIVCNGATLTNDAKFDKLKSVLSNAWGANKVPDLRGTFMRGVNNGRTGTYSDPDSNRDVGSFQDDEFKSHDHKITDPGHEHEFSYRKPGAHNKFDWGNDQRPIDHYDNVTKNTHSAKTGITMDFSGGNETHPVNAAVNFIIKY